MFAERHEFFSSALWELSLLPRGKRRDDCLEESARGLGGGAAREASSLVGRAVESQS